MFVLDVFAFFLLFFFFFFFFFGGGGGCLFLYLLNLNLIYFLFYFFWRGGGLFGVRRNMPIYTLCMIHFGSVVWRK